jgi:hypothetical protein
MKRPDFQEKTEVKVIDRTYQCYGARGTVAKLGVSVDCGEMLDPAADKEAIKKAYAGGLEPKMAWYAGVRFADPDAVSADGGDIPTDPDGTRWFKADELEPVQRKFVDIDYIREEDLVIGKKEDGTDAVRPKNTGAFEPGDLISITTKIDGANASIAWDETTGRLEVFSRTNLLDSPGALRGFYDYVKTEVEPKLDMSKYPGLVVFGEWCVKHSVAYNEDWYNKWRVYDVFDRKAGRYMTQKFVQEFCRQNGLEYVEELYYGPFVSWEHCRSFVGKSTAYGPEQEGVVVKNMSRLWDEGRRDPAYLKIVDERFKESHKVKAKREPSPEEAAAKERGAALAASVVTEARVRKIILKLVDEGKLPAELGPKDMGAVMKQLPKLVFDDVLKEEPEILAQIGDGAGKFVSAEAAKQARKIVIGG